MQYRNLPQPQQAQLFRDSDNDLLTFMYPYAIFGAIAVAIMTALAGGSSILDIGCLWSLYYIIPGVIVGVWAQHHRRAIFQPSFLDEEEAWSGCEEQTKEKIKVSVIKLLIIIFLFQCGTFFIFTKAFSISLAVMMILKILAWSVAVYAVLWIIVIACTLALILYLLFFGP